MKLRPGRRNPRNLYIQVGDEPSDLNDLPVGFLVDTDVAALISDGLTSPWHLNEIRLTAEGRGDQEPGRIPPDVFKREGWQP